MEKFTYIYKEGEKVWFEGVRRYKPPAWTKRVPNKFQGFVKITSASVTLFNEDWTIRKNFRK